MMTTMTMIQLCWRCSQLTSFGSKQEQTHTTTNVSQSHTGRDNTQRTTLRTSCRRHDAAAGRQRVQRIEQQYHYNEFVPKTQKFDVLLVQKREPNRERIDCVIIVLFVMWIVLCRLFLC
jgi:hypothetical protein